MQVGLANETQLDTLERNQIRELLDIARNLRKLSDYTNCMLTLDSALQISQSTDDYVMTSDILTEKGVVSMYTSNSSDALRYIQSGLAIRQGIDLPNKLAESYNYIAAIHQIQGNFQTAAKYYKLSLDIIEESGDKRDLGMVTNNLGSLYEDLADYTRALIYHNRSLELWQELKDSSWVSVSLRHIGQCYRSTGKLDDALKAFEKSYEISKNRGTRLNMIYATQQMGLLYLVKKNYNNALKWLNLSYELSLEENYLVKVQECASSLARIYEELNQYDKALKFHKIGIELKDSIFGTEMTKEITELEMNFQFEKEQLEDSLKFVRTTLIQDKKISNQRIGLVSTGVITLIMIILALVVYHGKQKSEGLLLNILPKKVADELKETGKSKATKFENVTVIFTDFKGFTEMSEKLSAENLVAEINLCFSEFDSIMTKYRIEKIKTIGDAYMAASGLPEPNEDHAVNAVDAAIEMIDFINSRKEVLEQEGKLAFEMRVGVNSGSVIAGIVGTKKFQYDIWGDTVNIAARMESGGKPGRLNISRATYELVKDDFNCMPRGKFEVKGKGEMEMYFVEARNSISLYP